MKTRKSYLILLIGFLPSLVTAQDDTYLAGCKSAEKQFKNSSSEVSILSTYYNTLGVVADSFKSICVNLSKNIDNAYSSGSKLGFMVEVVGNELNTPNKFSLKNNTCPGDNAPNREYTVMNCGMGCMNYTFEQKKRQFNIGYMAGFQIIFNSTRLSAFGNQFKQSYIQCLNTSNASDVALCTASLCPYTYKALSNVSN